MRPFAALLLLAACKPNGPAPPDDDPGDVPDEVDADADGSPEGEDCDEGNPTVRPGIPEACDGLDTDCDPGTGEDGLATVGLTTSSDLQAVLDDASVGEEVSVCAGVWQGPFTTRLALTVRGRAGAEATVIQGATGADALTVAGGEIGGLTVTIGKRGIVVEDGAEVLLTGLIVSGFDAGTEDGGGIVVGAGATATLDASTVTGNAALRGAGIVVGDGASLTLTESFVDGNTATELGGGLLVHPGATVSGGTVRQNDAPRGGGIALLGAADLTSMLVTYNNATAFGGGLHVEGPGPVTLTDVLVSANTAEPPGQELTEGAGVYADGTALSLLGDSTVTLNVGLLGGGLSLRNGASVTGGLVIGNIALLQGGGIYATTPGSLPVVLDGFTLQANRAALSGGGLQVATGAVSATDVVFDANDGGGVGGGFAQAAATELTLTGAIVQANVATAGGGGSLAGVEAEASTLTCAGVDFGADLTANVPSTLQVGPDVVNRTGVTTISCVSDRGCQ